MASSLNRQAKLNPSTHTTTNTTAKMASPLKLLRQYASTGLLMMVSCLSAISFGVAASAQSLDNDQGAVEMPSDSAPPAKDTTHVGRKAAQKYMAPAKKTETTTTREVAASRSSSGGGSSSDHFLAVHIGSFISDNAYRWGAPDAQSNVGSLNLGVTYRIGEWYHSMDLAARVDFLNYKLGDGTARKLSFMPVIMFPDASSKFPLYFGGGAGLGVFTQQLANKSALSLDYSLFAGVRFFDLYQNTGAFIEAGLKNHFLLLSDGQFNGYFASVGAVFTF